jgi:hypothetical protein
MYQVLGALTDVVHAILMVAWVVALPLLFVKRWPRLRRLVSVYAIFFILLNQGSRLVLGECFLTTISRFFWQKSSPTPAAGNPEEWFTVRFSQAVFHMTPSHRSIVLLSEGLGLLTACAVVYSYLHDRWLRREKARAAA